MTDDLRRTLAAALDGTYTLGEELGGGMARVFAATECALGRRVVLKVLPAELDTRATLGRFRREVRVVAALQHPHVVPLLHAGVAAGLLYYTMPFVAGESLRARLVREGPLGIARGASVLHDVAEALAYAHAHGVVHRDVKPGNVLLAGDDALVIDFGVATAIAAAGAGERARVDDSAADVTGAALTECAVVIGTPGYVSPEQAAGDPVDHRTDLYSLGCVAYEVFAGVAPFAGRSGRALLAAHMFEVPEPLARRRPDLPTELAELVTRCLAKDPADRPQHAADLLPALARFRVAAGAVERVPNAQAAEGPVARIAEVARAFGRRRGVRAKAVLPVGVALAAAVGAALWARANATGRGSGPVADASAVAVAPFRVLARDTSLAFLSEGMGEMLAARMGGTTRVVDPAATLVAWRRAARDGGASGANVAALARSLGVRRVITGEVVGTGSRLTISASLLDLPNRGERRAGAEGPPDSLPAVVDRLAGELLALAAGESPSRAARMAAVPPAAIREYLAGRALQRRGAWEAANRHFLAAVQADSTFASAALQLSITGPVTPATRHFGFEGLRLAWQHRDHLSEGDLAIADARAAWYLGDVVAPGSELVSRAERAVEAAPDEPEAWRWLGSVLFQWGNAAEVPAADARALAAFDRAAALDPGYGDGEAMRATLYALRDDSAGVRRALSSGLAPESDAASSHLHSWLAGVLLGDRARLALARRHFAPDEEGLHSVVRIAVTLGVGLDDADSVVKMLSASAATPEAQQGALAWARLLYLARGQPARVARVYAGAQPVRESSDDAALTSARRAAVDAALGDGDPVLGERARRALGGAFSPGVPPERVAQSRAAAAIYDLAHDDARTARRVLAAYRRGGPGAIAPLGEARVLILPMLEAWAAVVEHRPEARRLTERLDSLLRPAPPMNEVPNLVASLLWERLGDAPRALAASRRRTRSLLVSVYPASFLRQEARLAAAAGDTAGAIGAGRVYVRLRADAEPALRADLDSARRQLARLERAAGPR